VCTLLICWGKKIFNFLNSRGLPGVRGPQVKNRCPRAQWLLSVLPALTINNFTFYDITLMMEAVSCSETSVNINQTTRRNIPEDGHLHQCALFFLRVTPIHIFLWVSPIRYCCCCLLLRSCCSTANSLFPSPPLHCCPLQVFLRKDFPPAFNETLPLLVRFVSRTASHMTCLTLLMDLKYCCFPKLEFSTGIRAAVAQAV
jgi:hypothetical protein